MKYYACEYCPMTTYSRKSFIRHRVNHTGIWPFTCEVCGKVRCSTGGSRFDYLADGICSAPFVRPSFLSQTEQNVRKLNNSSVSNCRFQGFSERFQALKHVRHQHALSSDTTLNCGQCPRVFVDDASFAAHLDTHQNLTGQTCDLCHKLYENQPALEVCHSMSASCFLWHFSLCLCVCCRNVVWSRGR